MFPALYSILAFIMGCKVSTPENFLANAMLEQKALGSIILNYISYNVFSFHIFLILKLLPLDTLCGVQ